MILGVSHLVAKRDVHNSVFTDSPLSPKRQAQIGDIITRLARFRPTKVLVEADYGQSKWQTRYEQYLRHAYTLGANEVYQFGFKLAAQSGDRRIYPIDTDGIPIYDETSPSGKRIDAYLRANFRSVDTPQFAAFLKRSDDIELHGTYLDLLRYLNTDAAIRANASWYSVFAGLGPTVDHAGATYVSQWYTRNTFIFANILNVIKPGDRVVVIMGQGHEYLLREFARLNPNIVTVDPLTYLR